MSKAKYAKLMKITYTILMVFMFVACANQVLAAEKTESITPSSLTGTGVDVSSVQTLGGQIISIVSSIGIVASVLVLIILGIKYMIGSASEKAEYKKTMIPYLIGAVLVFGASGIATLVMNISKGIGSTK